MYCLETAQNLLYLFFLLSSSVTTQQKMPHRLTIGAMKQTTTSDPFRGPMGFLIFMETFGGFSNGQKTNL